VSISQLFASLGAPLANNRWSWGAQRPSDGAVFLRVWQDLKFIDDLGPSFMVLSHYAVGDSGSLGGEERAKHVESIRQGSPCYMVMCVARDVEDPRRQIKEFDDRDIFIGGALVDTFPGHPFDARTSPRTLSLAKHGATWVRLAGRKPIDSVGLGI
jgi:hypothetical protein